MKQTRIKAAKISEKNRKNGNKRLANETINKYKSEKIINSLIL
ncbi:hypothetical protein [Peptostreptococcus stomatis]